MAAARPQHLMDTGGARARLEGARARVGASPYISVHAGRRCDFAGAVLPLLLGEQVKAASISSVLQQSPRSEKRSGKVMLQPHGMQPAGSAVGRTPALSTPPPHLHGLCAHLPPC